MVVLRARWFITNGKPEIKFSFQSNKKYAD
jgi:hypothetical protein